MLQMFEFENLVSYIIFCFQTGKRYLNAVHKKHLHLMQDMINYEKVLTKPIYMLNLQLGCMPRLP